MNVALEWFNQNGMSPQAFAFFTGLFAAVGGLFKFVNDGRKESRDANQAAVEARESADKAAKNTQNVSNGFANTVLAELRGIREDQAELNAAFNRHLEWHLKEGNK